MENEGKKRNINRSKLQFAVRIGYFNHVNLILNILITIIIDVISGVVLIGLTNMIMPLIVGNYLHFFYLFLIFSGGEILIKYLIYLINFKAVIRRRGLLMFPYYILIFYIGVTFLDVYFVNFLTIFIFTMLYVSVRFGLTILHIKLQLRLKKETANDE